MNDYERGVISVQKTGVVIALQMMGFDPTLYRGRALDLFNDIAAFSLDRFGEASKAWEIATEGAAFRPSNVSILS